MWTSNHENTKYSVDPPIKGQGTNGHILAKAGATSLPCKSKSRSLASRRHCHFFIDPFNPAYVT